MPNFMTRKTYEKLMKESNRIMEVDLPKLNKAKQAAAEEGDLSENAEYQACKEKIDQLQARYRLLQSRMEGVQFIDDLSVPGTVVSIGTQVVIQNLQSKAEETYILLGSEDADPENNIISIASPFAKGMIGKKPNEETTLNLPDGELDVRILSISPYNIN